jgi:hypothetical protein
MSIKSKSLTLVKTILAVGAMFGFVTFAFAGTWTAPTAIPPDGNVDAPINVSATAQTKAGALALTGFANYGTSSFSGLATFLGGVSIGTSSTPATTTMLGVNGGSLFNGPALLMSTIQIAGGSPGAGKVLTATNSSGNAAWQTPVVPGVAHDTTMTGAGTTASPLHVVATGTGGGLSGGTNTIIPKWTSATTLGNSEISDNGSTVSDSGNMSVAGSFTVTGGESHFYYSAVSGSGPDPRPGIPYSIKADSIATNAFYDGAAIKVYEIQRRSTGIPGTSVPYCEGLSDNGSTTIDTAYSPFPDGTLTTHPYCENSGVYWSLQKIGGLVQAP